MHCNLPRQLSDFDSDMRLIDSVWLRDEINKLRPKGISQPGFSIARKDAQVKPATNILTLNESIRVIFICLYKPNKKPLIKKLIGGPNLNLIHPLRLNEYVDQWIQLDYSYARDLVVQVYQFKLKLSIQELEVGAKKLGVDLDLAKVRKLLRTSKKRRLRSKTVLSSSETRMIALNLSSLSKSPKV